MRALLDVNVLIALLDADHVHHARARTWLHDHSADGWASCPITQNGCARIRGFAIDVPLRRRIAQASIEQLETWLAEAVAAGAITDVFQDG